MIDALLTREDDMKTSWGTFLKWLDETRNESMDWHEANKHFTDEAQKQAFIAAYREGYMKALRLVQLHGQPGN